MAVSYAINSQALCASLDQFLERKSVTSATPRWSNTRPAIRWFGLTLVVSVSSYLVSNAIPFFKDLVGLIGALTRCALIWLVGWVSNHGSVIQLTSRCCLHRVSVPLSLTLPAILHRRANHISLMLPDLHCLSSGSYLLFLYSLAFLAIGLIGAISSIDEDWLNHGSPFSCR